MFGGHDARRGLAYELLAFLRREGAVALRQLTRLARPGWWRRAPFLPVPDAGYLAFRWSTAYGAGASPRPSDVLAYLRWCRGRER